MAKLTISAIGDIAVVGNRADKPAITVLSEVEPGFSSSDLVVANLENPLVREGQFIPGKFILRGAPEWAQILKASGIGVVSLANNHLMDYGASGLLRTMQVLDEAGVKHIGAGRSREEACAPLFLDIKGSRIAILARTSVVVSSPSHAGSREAGVAFLDMQEMRGDISACKWQADTVILLLHWGLEEYGYPPPRQRKLAKALTDAGVDIIIGHHPHVLQGVERIGRGLICYSLGNFLFDDVEWSLEDREGRKHNLVSRLSDENRKGGLLKVAVSGEGVDSYELIPTRIDRDGIVRIENTIERKRGFRRLCSRLHWPAYSLFWRMYSLSMELKLRLMPMTIGRLKWTNIKKIRLKHFMELYNGIRRSGRIAAEKSTNPYE